MSTDNQQQITVLINQWIQGDKSIENDLIGHLYPLLRDVAHKQLRKSNVNNLDTTMIVNELYLKLQKQNSIHLNNKNHFLALSSQLVRQIIIDIIRSNNAAKRGALYQHLTFNDKLDELDAINNEEMTIDWLTLDHLLTELSKVDPDSVTLIELRFFGGLSMKEIADIKGVSLSTVSNNWKFAKTWLLSQLKK